MTIETKNLTAKLNTIKSLKMAVDKATETNTPLAADISGKHHRDASFKRFRVDENISATDKGVTRIHDMVNDPDRDCVWGITRSDTYDNYVFKIDRAGVVTKAKTNLNGVARDGRGMMLTWGGGYLWAAIYTQLSNVLLRIDPDTMELTYYSYGEAVIQASCLTYYNGYIFLALYELTGPDSTILKFDVANETFSPITVSNVTDYYWAVFDGEYSWFSGQDASTNNAILTKMAFDGTYTNYDLGVTGGGAEISYDGTYIWRGANAGDKILVRFDIENETSKIIYTKNLARLNEVNNGILWLVNSAISFTRMDTKSLATELPVVLDGLTYSHGLTFDGINAWIGSWQDECYIWRVPILPFSLTPFTMLTIGREGTVYGGATGTRIKYVDVLDLSDSEDTTQIPIPSNIKIASLSLVVKSNTLSQAMGFVLRKNGADEGPGYSVSAGGTGVFKKEYADMLEFDAGDLLSIRIYAGSSDTGNAVIGKAVVEYYLDNMT